MKGKRIAFPVILGLLFLAGGIAYGRSATTPLEFLKGQERRHKGEKGRVYLGKVLRLESPASSLEPEEKVHGLLLELTDVLKTPLRDDYRLVVKGCPDGVSAPGGGAGLSRERAERVKAILVEKYGIEESRISTEEGCLEPGGLVEIHVYGEVSKAVRFVEEEKPK